MKKSQDIYSLTTFLHTIDNDMEDVKKIIDAPFVDINIENELYKGKIFVSNNLKKSLANFLEAYYNKEKEKIYEQIKGKLNNR